MSRNGSKVGKKWILTHVDLLSERVGLWESFQDVSQAFRLLCHEGLFLLFSVGLAGGPFGNTGVGQARWCHRARRGRSLAAGHLSLGRWCGFHSGGPLGQFPTAGSACTAGCPIVGWASCALYFLRGTCSPLWEGSEVFRLAFPSLPIPIAFPSTFWCSLPLGRATLPLGIVGVLDAGRQLCHWILHCSQGCL